MGHTRTFTRSRVLRAIAVYLALWGITQLFGASRVRAAVASAHLPSAQERRRLLGSECETIAVAPFLVLARYDWVGGPLVGEGGMVLYAWLGGAGFQVWESPVLTR